MSWASELRPDAPSLIALDGKTARRSRDRAAGKAALHLISAFAASGDLAGALVAIDAIACNPGVAQAFVGHGAASWQ